jgi:hypothetical protein
MALGGLCPAGADQGVTAAGGGLRERAAHLLAILGAAIGWAALVLQYLLVVRSMGGTGAALWRFTGYFTILTNIAVALILTATALRPAIHRPRVEGAVAVAIVMVGITYSLLLRRDLTGEAKVADLILHDLMPLYFTLFWLLRPHGSLRPADISRSLIAPLGYCLYGILRGAADGWFAYPFLDPTKIAPAHLLLNVAGMAAGFAGSAALLVAIDRRLSGS